MIGQNKFFEKLELLESENIVWEGGASKSGVKFQVARGIFFMFSVFIFLVFLGLFTSFQEPNSDEIIEKTVVDRAVDIEAQSDEDNDSDKSHIKIDMQKYVKRLFIGNSVFLLFSIALLYWYAVMRVRSYWMVVTNERICIQSGIFDKKLAFVDIDKVVSVVSTQPVFAKYFNLHNLEIIHSGVGNIARNGGASFYNPYKMIYVDTSEELSSRLLLNWLPRDNK